MSRDRDRAQHAPPPVVPPPVSLGHLVKVNSDRLRRKMLQRSLWSAPGVGPDGKRGG